MEELTQKQLKSIINYDPLTGLLAWKVGSSWKNVGSPAGGVDKVSGYWQVIIDGKKYYGHRLAFLYVYGYFPENTIDHINNNGLDNRIDNLRHVSQRCNTRNRKMNKNNSTGVSGVSWNRFAKKWISRIRVDYKAVHLGSYGSFEDAVKARWVGENKYDFPDCATKSSALRWLRENNIPIT